MALSDAVSTSSRVRDRRNHVAVVDVGNRRHQVLEVRQAELDQRVRIAVDVEVREAADEVEAVVDVIRPVDLHELLATASTLELDRELLVFATPAVVQVPDDGALAGVGDLGKARIDGGDLQRAIAHLRIGSLPGDLRARAIRLARELELHLRVERAQNGVVREPTEVAENVVNLAQILADEHFALDVSGRGHGHADHDAEYGNDDDGDNKF